MTKEGYQPIKTKKTTKIILPNTGSHVQMKKDGYTWEDLDRSYWEGFDNAKNKMEKRIEELEEKISILLSCKNCPENKGGLLCQKEYEDKCLAQKIQYIKELKEENAELKNQIEKMKCCANCKYQCQFLYQIADCLKNGLFKWEILEASLND